MNTLVNDAGGSGALDGVASTWEATNFGRDRLAVNVVGVYVLLRTLRPHLRRPGGRIVNLSSVATVRGGGDMYSAAKAGVVGLTFALAR